MDDGGFVIKAPTNLLSKRTIDSARDYIKTGGTTGGGLAVGETADIFSIKNNKDKSQKKNEKKFHSIREYLSLRNKNKAKKQLERNK